MRFCASMILILGAVFQPPGPTFAHHSFASEFDNSRAVTVTGVVVSVEMLNPHSFIYLDVKSPDGTVERWALEGPGPRQVSRRGLDHRFITPGDELGACGYLARSDAGTVTEPGKAKAARKLQAAVLTMPTGERLVWNNYRQRKCGMDT